MKPCSRCGVKKPLTEYRKNKANPDGHSYVCKSCKTTSDRKNAYMKLYNITIEDYDIMMELQDGVCAICGEEDTKRLAVDHDHITGKVRGLLCSKCNHAIGLFLDSKKLLQNAIEYLGE